MISFAFKINNPWPFKWGKDRTNLVMRDWKISRNKSFELQLAWWSRKDTIIGFGLDAPLRGYDHAGINLEIDLLGLCLILNLYDRRHWDHATERWESN
jgi:hypothetical protein